MATYATKFQQDFFFLNKMMLETFIDSQDSMQHHCGTVSKNTGRNLLEASRPYGDPRLRALT